MRGSLHFATDGETVCRFGRDDDGLGVVEMTTSWVVKMTMAWVWSR